MGVGYGPSYAYGPSNVYGNNRGWLYVVERPVAGQPLGVINVQCKDARYPRAPQQQLERTQFVGPHHLHLPFIISYDMLRRCAGRTLILLSVTAAVGNLYGWLLLYSWFRA